MFNNDLIGYLRKSTALDQEVLWLIETHLKEKLYYYGEHFQRSSGRFPKSRFIFALLIRTLHNTAVNVLGRRRKGTRHGLSSVGYTYDVILMEESSITIDRCNYAPKKFRVSMPGFWLSLTHSRIEYALRFSDFNYLISKSFIDRIRQYETILSRHVASVGYSFLLVPGDLDFSSRMLIKIFKQAGMPTFCLAHGGMPFIYDNLNETQTDYVSMWGAKQISGYINEGYDSSRFLITGHPIYKNAPKSLRWSVDSVLVLSKAADGMPSEIDSGIHNRSESLRYLFQIEGVLKSQGINQARLRIHPSENPQWYRSFVNPDFYQIETADLSSSLLASSLVIGPISTVFIDAIYHGVNYLVFEPESDGMGLFGRKLTLPLDGSDSRIPFASSVDDLAKCIKTKKRLSPSAIPEFCRDPCDFNEIIRIILG